MKKCIMSIIFINIFFLPIYAQGNQAVERLYVFRIISFHKKYEIYFALSPCGYYKYQSKYKDLAIYLTYEGKDFYEKCLFDEGVYHYTKIYPLNLWTNKKGEVFRMKKAYGPVTEKDRERTGTDYGYNKDYK